MRKSDLLKSLKYRLRFLPDKIYIRIYYRLRLRKKLNLDNPTTFNEKLQWLKINDRKPEYTNLVDKLAVREYIQEILGEEYLIPLLGQWNHYDDIDFEKLPEKFVLKCTHDSGGVVICHDKNSFDHTNARKKLEKCLKRNFFYIGREYPYKNIQAKLIAEEFISDSDKTEITDYKFFCTRGTVHNVMVCFDRESGDPKFYFFDCDWNLLRYNKRGKNAPKNFSLPQPAMYQEMIDIAARLSKDLSFVRVDLYCTGSKIYFGELTLYPQSGFDPNILPETDLKFGKLIDLNNI